MSNIDFDKIARCVEKEEAWPFIDYYCIKCKKDTISVNKYCLEGHPDFEKKLFDIGVEYINRIKKIGCYAIAEVATKISEMNNEQKVAIKVNITNLMQIKKILSLFDQYLSNDLKNEIIKIDTMFSNICNSLDYRSIYFLELVTNNGINISSVKFYFKAFGYDEEDINEVAYWDVLENISFINQDKTFESVKKIVKEKKVNLRCIGLEILNGAEVKIKYYVKVRENMKTIFDSLKGYLMENNLDNTLDETIKFIDKKLQLNIDLIQLTSGVSHEKIKDKYINLYCKNVNNPAIRVYYALREDLILRDIGDVYFLIDINSKEYYDLKILYEVNRTGKEIIKYMQEKHIVTIEGIVSYLKTIIKNYTPDMHKQMMSDCELFIKELEDKKYVVVVGKNVC